MWHFDSQRQQWRNKHNTSSRVDFFLNNKHYMRRCLPSFSSSAAAAMQNTVHSTATPVISVFIERREEKRWASIAHRIHYATVCFALPTASAVAPPPFVHNSAQSTHPPRVLLAKKRLTRSKAGKVPRILSSDYQIKPSGYFSVTNSPSLVLVRLESASIICALCCTKEAGDGMCVCLHKVVTDHKRLANIWTR